MNMNSQDGTAAREITFTPRKKFKILRPVKSGSGKEKKETEVAPVKKIGEHRHRSILKAISYRVAGTFFTFLVAYLFTGKFIIAASRGGVEAISKIFVYYWHERLWNRINYGKEPERPEYEI
jgi:uncharacterized membrane protein